MAAAFPAAFAAAFDAAEDPPLAAGCGGDACGPAGCCDGAPLGFTGTLAGPGGLLPVGDAGWLPGVTLGVDAGAAGVDAGPVVAAGVLVAPPVWPVREFCGGVAVGPARIASATDLATVAAVSPMMP
ncbi:MAG: hypothetical protein AAFP69_01940, partial [Planctomycetota bacterium]